MSALDRFLPPGFRAMSGVAGALLLLGGAQLCGLAFRDEPFPLAAAALALLFASGGASLIAFIRMNLRKGAPRNESLAPASAADLLTAAGFLLLLCEALYLLGATGTFFPLRMALAWAGALSLERLSEPALPMMLAGTCLIALGAAATASLCGALWVLLYSRALHAQARAAGAALSFFGAVPYVAFALVVRALLCRPVAFRAAGQFLALRPDEHLAYRSLQGMAPGLLAASLALGLGLGRGLWSWLDQVRAAEESSDSFLIATVRGQRPWEIVLRQGIWLRRRRDLAALFLGGMASAGLIDILSNTLIDSFRAPGFPPYPSLGAALFLRGLDESGMPAALLPALRVAHAGTVLAALFLLLAQTFPRLPGRVALRNGALSVGGNVLAREVMSAPGLAPRPSLQWVLGASGSGKSTLLRGWAAQLRSAVVVPQDPDEALAPSLSAADLARLARRVDPRGDRVLWDVLGRLGDERLRRRLFDPFTPVSEFSRGERQRLVAALAFVRARGDPDCTLLFDEPTCGQDAQRRDALLELLRELLPERFAGQGSLVVTSHDPESIDALLGDRAAQGVADHVLWLEQPRAHRFTVRSGRWEGEAPQPQGLQRYLAGTAALLEARDRAPLPAPAMPGRSEGVALLRGQVALGGRRYAVSPQARLRGGQLAVLSGPSGSGKTSLLRQMADRPAGAVEVGYVPQDPARAFPAEMPVHEVLGTPGRSELLRHWFGSGLDAEVLSRPFGALSEGERHRILLAGEVLRLERAGPRAQLQVLLLDEPFGALDPAARLRLMDALLEWLKGSARRAAVLVSHSPLSDLGLAQASGVPTAEWTLEGGAT